MDFYAIKGWSPRHTHGCILSQWPWNTSFIKLHSRDFSPSHTQWTPPPPQRDEVFVWAASVRSQLPGGSGCSYPDHAVRHYSCFLHTHTVHHTTDITLYPNMPHYLHYMCSDSRRVALFIMWRDSKYHRELKQSQRAVNDFLHQGEETFQ